MPDKPKEIHYLPGFAGSQAMTRVIQLNVFPWQISPIMLQTKKEFCAVEKDSLGWDPVRALSCLGLLLAIFSSHQYYTETLRIISLFHWRSMLIWCQGKRQSPVLSLQFCHRNWGFSLQKSIYKGPCFLSPFKWAQSSQELKDSGDAAKGIDFLSASSPHRNDASRANSLPKSGSWQYRHPRGLLLTSFPPHMTLDYWILKVASGWFICLRKIKP